MNIYIHTCANVCVPICSYTHIHIYILAYTYASTHSHKYLHVSLLHFLPFHSPYLHPSLSFDQECPIFFSNEFLNLPKISVYHPETENHWSLYVARALSFCPVLSLFLPLCFRAALFARGFSTLALSQGYKKGVQLFAVCSVLLCVAVAMCCSEQVLLCSAVAAHVVCYSL